MNGPKHELSALQKRLLVLLEWFHGFCVENNLKYYILGGTMLGAARHQGFIPWDDDVDVGMPRSDYDKFIELSRNKKFGDFIIESIDTDKNDFLYGYSKIYDTESTLIENTRLKIKRGIYIDLFPLDGVSNNRNEIEGYVKPILQKYKFLLARTCAVSKRRKWYKNAAILFARMLPGRIADDKKLMLNIDRLCRRRDYYACEYVGNLLGNWGIREIVPRSVMGEPKLYRFEDLEVYGVSDYDAYLTSLYGDWRQPPPADKQITHHDYLLLDLDHSYLEDKI